MFREHGAELSLRRWSACVGTVGGFDPAAELSALTGPPVERAAAERRAAEVERDLRAGTGLRPGVAGYLAEGRARGLRLGIVSSSSTGWIEANLRAVGAGRAFDVIRAAEGDARVAKPRPDLYLAALADLSIGPDEAVAFEDSPNRVAAAKAADLFCVAVPNPVTATLDLSAADLRVGALADLPLPDLLARLG